MDDRKKKIARIGRILVPVILAGLFASLAIFEKNGLFASIAKSTGTEETHPAAVKVPLTRLAVLNRLENEGFEEVDGTLLKDEAAVGMIAFEEDADGSLHAGYALEVLPVGFGAEQEAADLVNVKLVFRSLFEAAEGGTQPAEKDITKGENILGNLFASDKEQTKTLTTDRCTVTFSKKYVNGMYAVYLTVSR